MTYLVRFEDQARKELSALDNSVKIKILKFLNKLKERDNPRSLGKPLSKNLSGYWGYRVGSYRIISKIFDKEITILILAIQKREVVYRIPKNYNIFSEGNCLAISNRQLLGSYWN